MKNVKNVLIVDDEKQFLESLRIGLEDYSHVFRVLTALDGEEAVQILRSKRIDLVVTDLRMPTMDGFELIAYMSTHFPDIPAIVLSAYASGDSMQSLMEMGLPRWLEKPIDLDLFGRCILSYFEGDFQEGVITGFSVSSFMQLMEMEAKTCLFEVETDYGKRGCFFFDKGVICDAWCDELSGDDAAVEMISWDKVHIVFKEIPAQKLSCRIEKPIMTLIMEGMLKKDERDGAKGSPVRTYLRGEQRRALKKENEIAIIGGVLTSQR